MIKLEIFYVFVCMYVCVCCGVSTLATGCGAFQNPPLHVAEIFRDSIKGLSSSPSSSSSLPRQYGGSSHRRFGDDVSLSPPPPSSSLKVIVFGIVEDANSISRGRKDGNLLPFSSVLTSSKYYSLQDFKKMKI